MAYYFFKTIKDEKGSVRVRPLPNQKTSSGAPILTSLNVQCGYQIRNDYPLGTVFGSTICELRNSTAKNFYSAGDLFPMGLDNRDYKEATHIPSAEMKIAYGEYVLSQQSEQTEDEMTLFSPDNIEIPKTLLEKIESDPQYLKPSINKDGFFVKERDWKLIVRNIIRKKNTLLTGPSGTGKTEVILLACKQMGIECNVFDMGSMYDPMAQMLGIHRLEKGQSIFDPAKFTEVIQRPGVILLDELSRSNPAVANILFPCLDSRRNLPVEMAGSKSLRTIPVHPECVFFATANIGAEYTGTNEIDRALLGRFFTLEMDYMPALEEAAVLKKRCGINQSDATNLATIAESIRELYNNNEISTTISTREMIAAAELVADGWSAIEALEATVLPLFEDEHTSDERNTVKAIFMKY